MLLKVLFITVFLDDFRVLHPAQMVFGFAAVSSVFVAFVYLTNNKAELRRFKRDHPGLSVFIVLAGGYVLVYLLGSVAVFLFGIALPLLGELCFLFSFSIIIHLLSMVSKSIIYLYTWYFLFNYF